MHICNKEILILRSWSAGSEVLAEYLLGCPMSIFFKVHSVIFVLGRDEAEG